MRILNKQFVLRLIIVSSNRDKVRKDRDLGQKVIYNNGITQVLNKEFSNAFYKYWQLVTHSVKDIEIIIVSSLLIRKDYSLNR
jgi:hypothetical protein